MKFIRKLPIPQEIKNRYPLSAETVKKKESFDREVAQCIEGRGKLLLVVGPCSADNEEAVLEYTLKLASAANEVREVLCIVPRVFTNKPRTACDGYMGLVHQPDPSGEEDLLEGLVAARRLFTRVACETGLFPADEILYPENYRYFSDILSYVTVGARSVEDQQHRMTASGLEIPAGMKNSLSGSLDVLANSVHAAQSPHRFLYRGWEVTTEGNRLAHGVLRGYLDSAGKMTPNYRKEDLLSTADAFMKAGLSDTGVLVDCSHSNSAKDYRKQPEVAFDVLKSMKDDSRVRGFVRGLMVESYLYDGNSPIGQGQPGCSITDSCLGFEKTRELILRTAEWAGNMQK